MLVVIVICTLVIQGVAMVGSAALRRQRAQTAADMAALAGAVGGRAAAAQVAQRNGSAVLEWREADGVVALRVQREGVVAAAAAT